MPKWIDVHTHLDMLDKSTEEILATATAVGISSVINIGTGHEDLKKIIPACEKYSPIVYGTLGFHPHEAKTYNTEGEDYILNNSDHPRIVAIGEIGLDYYYSHSDHDVQKKVFRRQLEIAEQKKLPVEIHTRDAEADTAEILGEYKGRVIGLLHCFTSSQDLAQQALDLGYNISFSGIVTFKKSQALRDIVRYVPLDRLHIETDAPFLAPEPHRGHKNHPGLLIHTAEVVAQIKGVDLETLSEVTDQNAKKLFSKMKENVHV